MNIHLKTVLLTVLTLSVFTLVVIELTGISNNSLNAALQRWQPHKSGITGAVPADDPRTQQVKAMPHTTLQFPETNFNFGAIAGDQDVKHVFKVKNTGANPLMIARTVASCGCTVPEFSKEPIPPGGEGNITVTFNPRGKSGKQHKNIMVYSNADPGAVSIGFDAEIKQ